MKTIYIFLKTNRNAFLSCFAGLIFLLPGLIATAQTGIEQNTTMIINPGTSVTSMNQLTIKQYGKLKNNGTLVCKYNLINENPGPDSIGTGAVVFDGTPNSTILGQNIFKDLTVNTNYSNNRRGLTIGGNTRVNGVLTFTHGCIYLGIYNLLLGTDASVAGTPSAASMVIAIGSGQLQKMFNNTLSSFTFPVGSEDVPFFFKSYSPVEFQFNSGNIGPNNYFGVNLVHAPYAGVATSYLNRYWNITKSDVADFSGSVRFTYPPADVVGTENDIFAFNVDPVQPWTAYSRTDVVQHKLAIWTLNSVGTFTGNLGDGTVPPAIRVLEFATIMPGNAVCADATQTLIIPGSGGFYEVRDGASATHIAGQNIIYYPGTVVKYGGYMHGYISTTYCTPFNHKPQDAPVAENTDQPDLLKSDNGFFKIYPNPTPGKFTLELKGDLSSEQAHVDIFGILGEKILSKDMILERTQEFSLAERPTGVYVIHVTSGANSKTEKIIKQ